MPEATPDESAIRAPVSGAPASATSRYPSTSPASTQTWVGKAQTHGAGALPASAKPASAAPGAPASAGAQISPSPRSTLAANESRPMGALLEPVLRQACDGRLSEVNWFRTDWQRGGALTGYATFLDDHARPRDVVVKLPVPPLEQEWLVHLQAYPDVVPRLYAHGQKLGAYDMAWLVMERLPHGPLGSSWSGREFDLLVEAVVRFYAAAADRPIDRAAPTKDWELIFKKSRDNIHRHNVAHEQRWSNAFKKAHRSLKEWLALWQGRSTDQWCHGDLHLANAMTRLPAPQGPAVLFDFAQTHPGHWIEDAVYLEHLFWSRRHRLQGRRLCSQIAHERKRLGLRVEPDWPKLASVRRALLAMTVPFTLDTDGDPHFIEAALQVLEIEAHV